MNKRIISITPINHISGVVDRLEAIGDLTIIEDPSHEELLDVVNNFDAIFTNPNKSKIFLDKKIFEKAPNLKVICTASTGTNHMNKIDMSNHSIDLLSLTEEREIINTISSTAEHALALTMSAVRNVPQSFNSVLEGEWNYEKFIGRQLDKLTVGIIGYGRLGSKYAEYILSLGSEVLVYDPYKSVNHPNILQKENLDSIFELSDIISIHVHVNEETTDLINSSLLKKAKKDLIIVNTARGEVINERDLIDFLESNPESKAALDVLADEIVSRKQSEILNFVNNSQQIIITPHVGGMTKEAQEIAYNHAAEMLSHYFNE
jgi:D-3-phosphoglycerate dehydrogenase